jgi:hypothetical protein
VQNTKILWCILAEPGLWGIECESMYTQTLDTVTMLFNWTSLYTLYIELALQYILFGQSFFICESRNYRPLPVNKIIIIRMRLMLNILFNGWVMKKNNQHRAENG